MEHVSVLVHVQLVGAQLDALPLGIQHIAHPREAQVAVVVQREAARPGVADPIALQVLDGEEAIPHDGEIPRDIGGFRDALGPVHIDVAVGPDVALPPDIGVDLLHVAHPAVHHIVKGTGGVAALLEAGGGHVDQVVAHHVQVLLLGVHARGQVIKALEHLSLRLLPLFG